MQKRIQCYTGISGSGKTSKVLKLSHQFKEQGIQIGGIATIGNFQKGQRHSFWVVDIIKPENKIPLAERNLTSEITIGSFGFRESGILWGNNCINKAIYNQVDILFIDEIGPLELSGQGWYSSVINIASSSIPHIIFTSRPSTLQTIQQTFFSYSDIETIEI